MQTRFLTAAVLAALTLLAACDRDRASDPDLSVQEPVTAPTTPGPAPVDAPIPTQDPAPKPPVGDATYSGYRALKFGMTPDAMKAAFGAELTGAPAAGETCYYLSPKGATSQRELAFMVEDGKFVRLDVGTDGEIAPGGGKVGMSLAELQGLYVGRIEEQPHKYTDGKYLRIRADDSSNSVVVFETDAAGTVTSWRTGMEPQIDYVEGCS